MHYLSQLSGLRGVKRKPHSSGILSSWLGCFNTSRLRRAARFCFLLSVGTKSRRSCNRLVKRELFADEVTGVSILSRGPGIVNDRILPESKAAVFILAESTLVDAAIIVLVEGVMLTTVDNAQPVQVVGTVLVTVDSAKPVQVAWGDSLTNSHTAIKLKNRDGRDCPQYC